MVSEGVIALSGVGIAFTLSGPLLLWYQHAMHKAAEAARDWDRRPVTINTSEIRAENSATSDNDASTDYSLTVEYTYEYAGTEYTGTTVYPDPIPDHEGSTTAAQAFLDEYEVGDDVEAFVNPDNPAEAALKVPSERRVRRNRILLTVFGILFTIGGVFALNELSTLLL